MSVEVLGSATAMLGALGARARALHGPPITVKDCFATAGIRRTAGKQDLVDHVPGEDAVAVGRLRAAGAIMLGKTNLPRGVSGQETADVVVGRTCNPRDPARTPGGSSSGSAVAVAVGMSPPGLGSDSGGSIRQPSRNCGAAVPAPSATVTD